MWIMTSQIDVGVWNFQRAGAAILCSEPTGRFASWSVTFFSKFNLSTCIGLLADVDNDVTNWCRRLEFPASWGRHFVQRTHRSLHLLICHICFRNLICQLGYAYWLMWIMTSQIDVGVWNFQRAGAAILCSEPIGRFASWSVTFFVEI